eukprot:5131647-Prymnesium_polylepis.1
MQHERTSPVRPRATRVKSPQFSGPHIDLWARQRAKVHGQTRSRRPRAARRPMVTDGASPGAASAQQPTHGAAV